VRRDGPIVFAQQAARNPPQYRVLTHQRRDHEGLAAAVERRRLRIASGTAVLSVDWTEASAAIAWLCSTLASAVLLGDWWPLRVLWGT
jgi:hypothetical protein